MDVVFKTDKAVFTYRVAGIWLIDVIFFYIKM